MVIPILCGRGAKQARRSASLIIEAVVAMGILAAVSIPLGYSFIKDQEVCRSYYTHSVAMEIVDGEMEILRSGEWSLYKPGSQPYSIHATAATNLPPGCFTLMLENCRIRLEWKPDQKGKGGSVVREAIVKQK